MIFLLRLIAAVSILVSYLNYYLLFSNASFFRNELFSFNVGAVLLCTSFLYSLRQFLYRMLANLETYVP